MAPELSIAYSSATTWWILFKFGTCVQVAMGKFSELGVFIFQPIQRSHMTKNMFFKRGVLIQMIM